MRLFKKKIQPEKTCKDCGYDQITETKRYNCFVLVCVCGQPGIPINVSKYAEGLSYVKPKWCPRR